MSIFPKIYTECPDCGCKETLLQIALDEAKEGGKVSKDIILDSIDKKEATPLKPISPQLIGICMVPMLVEHYNVCANCGRRRLTKAEIKDMAFQVGPQVRI